MKVLLSVCVLACSSLSSAAIPKKQPVIKRSALLRVLDLPAENRRIVLRQKKVSLKQLDQFAQNPKGSLQMRWRAITSLSAVKAGDKLVLRYVKPYLSSKLWWQRAAALVAMERQSPTMALEAAFKLIRDPALIVRSSAVDLISKKGSSADKNRLWPYLQDKINFHRGQGLWVRQQIIETLAADRVQPANRFNDFINDKDKVVQTIARNRVKK